MIIRFLLAMKSDDPRVLNRVVPITPQLAVRIRPNITVDRDAPDYEFKSFRYKFRRLSRGDVARINRLIIQCAETVVFFRKRLEWVPRFVARNSGFRIEPKTARFPSGNGALLLFTQAIREYTN